MNYRSNWMQINLISYFKYFVVCLVLLSFLISCGVSRLSTNTKLPSDQRQRSLVADEAQQFLGSPYKYGGSTRKGFDCSGLVYNVFLQANIQLPRTSAQQFRAGKSIAVDRTQKGDLIFFTQKGKINHVGIVIKSTRGSIWVIHSTTSKGVISEDVLASSYWRSRIKGARDVISNS